MRFGPNEFMNSSELNYESKTMNTNRDNPENYSLCYEMRFFRVIMEHCIAAYHRF